MKIVKVTRHAMGSAPAENQADKEPYGERYVLRNRKVPGKNRQEFHEDESESG